MVAFTARFQTALPVGASELVQVTGRYVGSKIAAYLVSAISAVDESIAFLFRGKANSAGTFEIFALAMAVTCFEKKKIFLIYRECFLMK